MATNSPIRNNSHLRRRVEAYASALYYSECSVGGISHDDAAQAKDTALSQQSRWWLNGNDPSHPSLQCYVNEMSNDDIKRSCQDDGIRTDDENEDDSDVENNPEEDEVQEPENDDMISNTPITVRDDDMGTSFGTMHSFRATTSPLTIAAASQPALQLPSWLTEQNHPQDNDTSSPRDVFVQSEASSDEVLQSYSSYQNKQYLTGNETSDSHTLPNSSPMAPSAAAPVTSESEADESIYSSSLSCDDSTVFYPKPRSQAIVGYETNTNSRKRCRLTADNFLLPLDQTYLDAKIEKTKVELLSRLENEGTTGPNFKIALATLEKYASFKVPINKKRKLNTSDADSSTNIDGTWLTVSAPEYKSSLGKNDQGEQLYTLGRMAFDMYQPADLVCSIQKQYITVISVEKKALPMYVPKSLREEVDNERSEDGSGRLKTYNIICSFTIEDSKGSLDDVTQEPLRGIMTNYGYALPDPTHRDRKSIWFTGGTIEPAEDNRLDEWQKIFATKADDEATEDGDGDDTSKKDKEAEKARKLASKILLGIVHEPMDDQGIVGYHLHRPIGGHGSAYVDVVYIDDDLRIMRGHSGSIYVLKKV